jgi:pSer/pThr/pTyr-binding forkhead associated (FHA) protein
MAKVSCPMCGKGFDYDPTNPYCPYCNNAVPPPSAPSPAPQPPVPSTPKQVGKAIIFAITKDGKEIQLTEIYENGPEIVVGRRDLINYAWRDPDTISRVHLKIKYENGKIFVRDDGSTNGTYINGRDIRSQGYIEVQAGQEIILVNPSNPVVKLIIRYPISV